MNFLRRQRVDLGADSQDEARLSVAALEERLGALETRRGQIPAGDAARHTLAAEAVQILGDLGKPARAWDLAEPALAEAVAGEDWQGATLICESLFLGGGERALPALGQSLWLSITFPVDPGLTVAQLRYVIEETPRDSDGAAVAAAMAAYVASLRSDNNPSGDLALAVGQMMNDVASRHGQVADSDAFGRWFSRLELDDPAKLAVRMRNIIDVLVQDDWWFDREALQRKIPED